MLTRSPDAICDPAVPEVEVKVTSIVAAWAFPSTVDVAVDGKVTQESRTVVAGQMAPDVCPLPGVYPEATLVVQVTGVTTDAVFSVVPKLQINDSSKPVFVLTPDI